MSKELLDKVKAYKNKLRGAAHSLFRGVLLCKLTGVTYDNRQKNLTQVKENTPIKLLRDRRNKYDFNAINVVALINKEWKDLGFIPSSMNKEISTALDAGVKLKAKVWKRSGGDGDFHRGLTITITRQT
ncbi:MAG: hypothetical protein KAS32_27010 [Candidatus Peribacteraceae bacterium]|nr:hypothetical protein [Candidatus Peribacteraceae bacterium]